MSARGVTTQLNLRQVKTLIRQSADTRTIYAVDSLLGVALLLSPAFTGFAGAAGLTLITPKNELIRLTQKALRRRGEDEVFTDKCERMAAAYCLNTFVAFFTAIDEALPTISGLLELSDAERVSLATRAAEEAQPTEPAEDLTQSFIRLPGAVRGLSDDRPVRRSLYEAMAAGTERFLTGLASWESAQDQSTILRHLQALPEVAEAAFLGQHISLLGAFPEFLAWETMKEREALLAKIAELGQTITTEQACFGEVARDLDVGLARLDRLIDALPAPSPDTLASKASRDLHARYIKAVQRPVIADYSQATPADLHYPIKDEVYVPQAFKALQYSSRRHSLEDEKLWRDIEAQQDIGRFVVGYLQTPYSLVAPLLLLGQPGSGKSLLTEMLAARLSPPAFNTVRVVLRDIHPEDDLQTQIEKSIHEQIGRRVDWAAFAEVSTISPPLVILDGFDELLQASGRAFSTYLTKLQDFQLRESDLGRPLRVMITSRLSLIDRARVPEGATVVRLLEFDSSRRERWVEVWNHVNRDFFRSHAISPFTPPQDERLLPLAEQPLLLLMLALYDSDSNQLVHGGSLDQTLLYHNLLVRFIRRERTKGKAAEEFNALGIEAQSRAIDVDLERLGVAALGMYNRQALHITRDELNEDIRFFGTSRSRPHAHEGVLLGEADLLLGSFFFIHEASATTGVEAREGRPKAFEFLHNTFGEFLTADFILRRLMSKITLICQLASNESLHHALQQTLESLEPDLLACLVHTALPSRPVILRMLVEWFQHKKVQLGVTEEEFLAALDLFLTRQIGTLLTAPELQRLRDDGPLPEKPVLGQVAVFTLNLVLLRTALSSRGYEFSERTFEDAAGIRAWDRLTHVWRSWFPLEALTQLSNLIVVRRDEGSVVLMLRFQPRNSLATSRLTMIIDVAEVLGDRALEGLAGLLAWEVEEQFWDPTVARPELTRLQHLLRASGVDVSEHVRLRSSWLGDYPLETRDLRPGMGEGPRVIRTDPYWPDLSPGQQALLASEYLASRRSVRNHGHLRPRLGPEQWHPRAKQTVTGGFVHALLTLNAAVEPRFLVHVVDELVRDDGHGAMAGMLPSVVESIIFACLPVWHVPVMREFLTRLNTLGEEVDYFSSRVPFALGISLLAARLDREDVLAAALVGVGHQTVNQPHLYGEVGTHELTEFANLLTRLTGRSAGPAQDCIVTLRMYVTDGIQDMPMALLCEVLRGTSRRDEKYDRILDRLTRGAYAATTEDWLTAVEVLHEHKNVAGLRQLLREAALQSHAVTENGKASHVLSAIKRGVVKKHVLATEAQVTALDWALSSLARPAKSGERARLASKPRTP